MNHRHRLFISLLFSLTLLLLTAPADLRGAPYDLKRTIPLRFTYQGADTLGWAKDTDWQTLVPFATEFNGYLSMGNVPLRVSVPATLVMECTANQIYAGNQVPCRAWIESTDDPDVKELSSNYGFSLGIKFRDWWTETDLANIGKDFAFKIEDEGRMPLGNDYLCGIDTIEFASLPIDWLIPGSGTAAKTVKGIFSTIGDSGVDLNLASLNIAGELVVEGNYVHLLIGNSNIELHGFRDPVAYPALTEIKNEAQEITGFNDPNVKPFALTVPSERTLRDDPNYYEGSHSLFYEPLIQYSMNLYNSAGLQFTLVPPLTFTLMASAVDRGENILSYACPSPTTLHDGSDYIPIAQDFKVSSDLNTTVSFPLTDAPDLPDIAVTEMFVNGEPKGGVFVNEWTDFKFKLTNLGNRDTQGLSATPATPEPLFTWSLWVDGVKARDIFGEEISFRKLDDNWIDRGETPAIVIKKDESYTITGFTHRFTTEGPHTLQISAGYNEYKATENGRPVYGIGDYNVSNNYQITFPIYVQAPRGTVQGAIETNPCSGDCGVNGVRVCLRDATGGGYNECRVTALYQGDTGPRNGFYRFGRDDQHPYGGVPTGDYYLEYLPVKPTAEQVAAGYPTGAYWAPRSFYFHHEGSQTDDFNYSTAQSGLRIYQYQNLKGMVMGSNGQALPGVTVRFGEVGPTATTDASGLFVFPDVPPFQQVTLTLAHSAHKTKRLVFSLSVPDSARRETTLSGDGSWTPPYWDSDWGNTSGRIVMVADATAPTLYVEPLDRQGFAGSELTFRIRSSDTDKDTHQYRYLIYDGDTPVKTGDWTAYAPPADPAGLFAGTADWTGVTLPDKAYFLVIQVRDAAGHITESAKIPFTKDILAPAVTAQLTDPARGMADTSYGKDVDVQITIANTEAGTLTAELSNDGGATWSDPVAFTGTATTIRQWRVTDRDDFSGTKTVHVRVTDAAGNQTTASDAITVDTTGTVYLAWGSRYTRDPHVPLFIDIVPPDGDLVYPGENGSTGDFRLGSETSNQYRAQMITLDAPITFNKIALSVSTAGLPPRPFVGAPGRLHVKIVSALDNANPDCTGCTAPFIWSADRDAILGLFQASMGSGLPLYSPQMVTLNPGTYYLLLYAESADAANYYMLYAWDYGSDALPSYIYVPGSGWQTAPLQGMMNRIPHISFQLWNNDPGEIRIAGDGDCSALTDLDPWQPYLYPAPVPYAYVDVATGDGWKTACVQYRNQSHPSTKDRSYYASVFLDENLPTATTDAVKLAKVDKAARNLYFDIAADDAGGSGPEWITWTVPGYARPMVPYQPRLVIDASTLPAFSGVTFTILDRAGNESAPLSVALTPEDDFFVPTLTLTVNDGGNTAYTRSAANNHLHLSAADNVGLAKIVIRNTLTAKETEVTAGGTAFSVDVPLVLPTFAIDGTETVLDGTYDYSAYAVDAAGNRSKAVQASITLDRQAPFLGGLYLTGSDGRPTTLSEHLVMGFTAKDEIGPLTLHYRINGGAWFADQMAAPGQNTLSLAGPLPLPSSYQVEVELKDGAGNTASASTSIRTNRPPATPNGDTPKGTVFTASPRLTPSPFSDADGDSLAASWFIVRKADDQTIVVNTAPLYGSSGVTLSLAELSYDVAYTWSARYLDSFGQWSAWSAPVPFILKRPTLTVVRSGPGAVESTGAGIECDDTFKDCAEVCDPGAQVTLVATPAAGYVFTGWSGACSGVADCRLVMDTDRTITASFGMAAAPLPGDLDDSGAVDLTDAITALQIQAGFHPSPVALSSDVNADWKIGLPETLYILQVLSGLRDLSLPSLTVLKPGNGEGTVTSVTSGIDCGAVCSQTYEGGATVTLTAAADSATSTFAGWLGACTGTGTECTVIVDAMKTVGAVFSLKTWALTPSIIPEDGSGGTIAPATAVQVDHGSGLSFAITPAAGYHITDVRVDGESKGAVTAYAFTNVTAGHTIAAAFARNTFTITATAGANGVISPSGTLTVNEGASQTFTITPSAGCHVADVLVNGVSLGSVTSHTFTGIAADHTISVTFARDVFTITARAEGGGTVSPVGSVTVAQGQSQAFSITPNEGCHTVDVLADGISVGPVGSYTFANLAANHALQALFAADVTFAAPDLAGEWRLAGIAAGAAVTAPYGVIRLDTDARATEGTLTYPEKGAQPLIAGGLAVDRQGLIVEGGWELESEDSLTVLSGKVAEGKNILSFVGQSQAGSPEWWTAMKPGTAIYPETAADLSGTWHLFGFRAGEGAGPLTGTLNLDAAGLVAAGSTLTLPGQEPEAIGGSLTGGLDASVDILTLNSGQIDAGRSLMTWTDSGKFAYDAILALKDGGSFPRAFLAGTWHIAGIEAETTWRGFLTLTGEGFVTEGHLIDVRGSETVVTGGAVDMATTGLIAKSALVLTGDRELYIDRGRMTADRNMIVWTTKSPTGSPALMLLLRGEPPR